MVKFTTICVFIMIRLRTPSCELFSSVAKMATLLQTQAHLIDEMEHYQHVVYEKERKIIKRFLANQKQDHAIFEQDREHFLGNPINCYTLTMRLYRDLLYVETFLNKTTGYKRNPDIIYPSKEDTIGVIRGMYNILHIYHLDVDQIANGKLNTSYGRQRYVENVSPMTANDCHTLAMLYLKLDDRSKAIAWLEAALRNYHRDRYLCSTFTEKDIIVYIAAQYYLMKNRNRAIFWLEKSLTLNPDDYSIMSLLEQVRKNYEEELDNPGSYTKEKEKTVSPYMLLCRNALKPVVNNFRLFCYYSHGPHPFLLLAPIKTELLYEEPYIAMFYDVITNREVKKLKRLAKPQLQRPTVHDKGSHKPNEALTIQSTFITANPVLSMVLRRVHQLSGLQWSKYTSESTQIGNYGIGGIFEPHYDAKIKEPSKIQRYSPIVGGTSDRIATALIYMSDVEQGGATVFPNINLTIFPMKNAAIFWYNLNPWGNIDVQTLHGACPVLRGSKWVLTKWINIAGQEIKRPCPVHPPPPFDEHDDDE